MPAGAGCCRKKYTTRSYDKDGNTLWTANYFRKLTGAQYAGGVVTSQVIDDARVYVGGSRMTKGSHSWNLMAFDIETGEFLWDRDLYVDAGSHSGYNKVMQLQIDPDGNIVAMIDPSNVTSPARVQYFVTIDTSGSFVSTKSFTQVQITSNNVATLGFTIDSDGDYHVLGVAFPGTASGFLYMYDWASPFSSAPTGYDFSSATGTRLYSNPKWIARFDDRDYFGGIAENNTGTYDHHNEPALFWSKSQTAAAHDWTDIDGYLPVVPTGLSSDSITATGTNQAGAAALTVGKEYSFNSGSVGHGVILPSGVNGDQVKITGSYSNLTLGIKIYPPSGGEIFPSDGNSLGVNVGEEFSSGDYYTCIEPDKWQRVRATDATNRVYVFVASSGNIYVTNGKTLFKYDSSKIIQWRSGTTSHVSRWSVTDDDENVYTTGGRAFQSVSIVSRDIDGTYLWGHKHLDTLSITSNVINFDSVGSQIIVSGYSESTGPVSPVDDVNFVSNPF